jgi:hypothetical protein
LIHEAHEIKRTVISAFAWAAMLETHCETLQNKLAPGWLRARSTGAFNRICIEVLISSGCAS